MTIHQAIVTLELYNKWRRGDEELEQPNPTDIGIAIDTLIKLVRSLIKTANK